jgi:hypothetical protein
MKKRLMVNTTKKHFELFKQYFIEYQNKFGLNNYNIYFNHKWLKNSYACIIVDEDGHVATVNFNTKWSKRLITNQEIKECALHECNHLLVNKLEWIGRCRYIGEEEIINECEGLVVRLTDLFIKYEKDFTN